MHTNDTASRAYWPACRYVYKRYCVGPHAILFARTKNGQSIPLQIAELPPNGNIAFPAGDDQTVYVYRLPSKRANVAI